MNDKYRACYEDLTIAAHRAYTRGLQTGSGGNLSVKIPEEHGMIVKNSGGSFADCDAKGNGWVAMNFDGTLKEGEVGKPTRDQLPNTVNSRYGISEIKAKMVRRSTYFFRLEVCKKPSTSINAKMGKDSRPMARSRSVGRPGKNR